MKNTIHIVSLAMAISSFTLAGCAGPAARHDARVDRRADAAGRVEDRATNRQENRYQRRGDRQERIDSRYGY